MIKSFSRKDKIFFNMDFLERIHQSKAFVAKDRSIVNDSWPWVLYPGRLYVTQGDSQVVGYRYACTMPQTALTDLRIYCHLFLLAAPSFVRYVPAC
jgi:hypothetical protein